MRALTLMPFFIASFMLVKYPPEKVFLWIALPMLLAVPTYYYFPLPCLPDLNFFHFAILPLFLWWLRFGWKEYRFGLIDFFVFLYASVAVLSEFMTMGAKDGTNIIIDRTVQIIIPFLLTKHFFRHQLLRINFFKIMVIIGALMAFLSPLEFKFDLAVVDVLQWVWPENLRWPGWPRYGFVRAAAVYGHPIIAGMMWSFFTLFALWLNKQKVWSKAWYGWLVVILNMTGLCMTISRGPMLGLFCGLVLLFVGWSKNRMSVFIFLIVCSIALVPPSIFKFMEYASIDRFNAVTETQENVAYRRELLDNYIEIINERPWLGHGRNGMPVVKGQKSIDNQYVYIALMHGAFAMYLFVGMTLFSLHKMLVFGATHPPEHKSGQLAWLFAACAGTWLVTLATVWMGAQSEQMIFMLFAMVSTIGLETREESHQRETINNDWQFRII